MPTDLDTDAAAVTRPFALSPPLPPGYEAQGAWGFADDRGGVYEFDRVYGPAVRLRANVPIIAGRLDEGRSFWRLCRPATDGQERLEMRFLSFAEARYIEGRAFTFAQFASPTYMRERLVALWQDREPQHLSRK